MKGALLGINPDAVIVDITHDIPPQNIHAGAWVLAEAVAVFPPDGIHVVVVDPGVGSGRRIICVQTAAGFFVAPDNGVLTHVLRQRKLVRAVQVTNSRFFRKQVSATFHGRDIMSPVAAHLSLGVDVTELGPAIIDLVELPVAEVQSTGDGLRGEIVFVDHFGNLITNIPWRDFSEEPIGTESFRVRVADREIVGVYRCYAEVESGSLTAVVGSAGFLEIAITNGSAQQELQAGVGDTVTVRQRS